MAMPPMIDHICGNREVLEYLAKMQRTALDTSSSRWFFRGSVLEIGLVLAAIVDGMLGQPVTSKLRRKL